jgi:HEAT repeat protein
MRNLFVLSLCCVGLALLISGGQAQPTDPKKPDDPEKILERLLKTVKQKDDVGARIQAIMDLADFGPKAEPALADLIDALQTKNEDMRLNAAIVLGKIGKPAVEPVAKLLQSDDSDTKFYAIWALGWIGPDAKATTPAMIKLMADKNEGVRRKAAFALGRLAGDPDKTMAVLLAAFKDESPEVRQAAGMALSKLGIVAVPPLIEMLKSDDVETWMQATIALAEIGADAKDAVPILKDRFLANGKPGPHHLSNILMKIGKPAVPALEAGLKSNTAEVRNSAAQALQQMGADAVPVLVDALGDKNVEVRRVAAQTLWPMRIGDKSVVIALAFGLADADETVRQHCMTGLAQLGAQAKLAGPKLKDALTDMSPNVRQQAYFLLQTIGDDPRPALTKALDSKDAKIRINTACLMVTVNFDRDKATPIVVAALKNDDVALKTQAAFTLAQARLEVDKVAPIFLESLKHKTPGIRVQGLQGLSTFGNTSAAHAPAIVEMLRDEDANVRQHAVNAIHSVGGKHEVVLPALTKIYKDGTADTRQLVMQVVWIYGGKAKDLVSSGLKDKDKSVRQQAVNAIQNMQGDITEAIPTILGLLKEKDSGVNRHQLVWVLARGGEAAVPALADLLKDKDEQIRFQAIQILRNMGPKAAAKAMPAVKEAISDSNPNVRVWAMHLIAQSGDGPEFLVKTYSSAKDGGVRASLIQTLATIGDKKYIQPLLKTAMKDDSTEVRQTVVAYIGHFGNSAEALEIFTLGLKDSDANIRINAAYHANHFGQKSWEPLEGALKSTKDSGFRQAIVQGMHNTSYRGKAGVPSLTDCLKDSNVNVRAFACNVLGNIGPDAIDALPVLRKLADDGSNVNVQQAARNAVKQIDVKR